jgi:hypothetical protein
VGSFCGLLVVVDASAQSRLPDTVDPRGPKTKVMGRERDKQ